MSGLICDCRFPPSHSLVCYPCIPEPCGLPVVMVTEGVAGGRARPAGSSSSPGRCAILWHFTAFPIRPPRRPPQRAQRVKRRSLRPSLSLSLFGPAVGKKNECVPKASCWTPSLHSQRRMLSLSLCSLLHPRPVMHRPTYSMCRQAYTLSDAHTHTFCY